jgi:O-antigen/teichoic acid export membrane protein
MDSPPLRSAGDPAESDPPLLSREELKHRTSAGVFIVGSRGVIVLVLAFGGQIAFARLLDPHAFGVIALGMSVMLVTGLLSDGGLGAALIRRPAPPQHDELAALVALQLGVSSILALLGAAIAAFVGGMAWVVAAMGGSMPIVALLFPGQITLERALSYRPLAVVEISQAVTYYGVAIGLVVAGLGVWGVAVAVWIRAVVATAIMTRVSPVGFVGPRFDWTRIRPLMGFGVRFQAVEATWILREQLLNALVAVIAGVSMLGLWRLAGRLMEVPYLLLHTLWRVSYPAMSQMVTADAVEASLIERTGGMAAIGVGTLLVGLAASAPGLVPGLFGEQWHEAAAVIPWSCLGLAIGGSVSVATAGYLYSVDDASAVLRSGVLQAIAWFAVTLPLLDVVGVSAVGLGWLAGSLVQAFVLAHATRRRIPVLLLPVVLVPVAIGTVAAVPGWLVANLDGDLITGIAGGALAVCLFQLGLLVFRRALLSETYAFGFGAMRAATSRRASGAT